MPETLLALLTAHLVGDFVFRPTWIARRPTRIQVSLLHVGVITLVSALLLRNVHWWILAVVFASHLAFDLIKIRTGADTTWAFIRNQLARMAVAFVLACLFPHVAVLGWWPTALQDWLPTFHASLCLISGAVLVVPAGGILIGKLTAPISEEIKESRIVFQGANPPQPRANDGSGDYLAEGLKNGGMYIGWLERFLTMVLILIGQPTGIGFLIAAKSILRFGEIKEARHRKLAEYIIIGTFLSFGWALSVTVLMQKCIEHWLPGQESESKPLKLGIESSAPKPQTKPPLASLRPSNNDIRFAEQRV